jgi:hypothetical protein
MTGMVYSFTNWLSEYHHTILTLKELGLKGGGTQSISSNASYVVSVQ